MGLEDLWQKVVGWVSPGREAATAADQRAAAFQQSSQSGDSPKPHGDKLKHAVDEAAHEQGGSKPRGAAGPTDKPYSEKPDQSTGLP